MTSQRHDRKLASEKSLPSRGVFWATECGAAGDGQRDDTAALQAGIDRVADGGGGRFALPPGRYLSGTLRLRSGVELHLCAGAVLLGSRDPDRYPVIAPTPHGQKPGQIQALLWIEKAEGAALTGLGAIDGQAEALTWAEAGAATFRPSLVVARDCRDLRFQDVTLRESCFWTLHLLRCQMVNIRGLTIRSTTRRPNVDGIDPDGCRDVTISDCHIDTGDDCIVLKSTEGDACENIAVSNCILSTPCAAIKLGTESIGPIRNVVVQNCVVRDTNVALALYHKDGGGFENVVFGNLVLDADSEFPIVITSEPRHWDRPAANAGCIRGVTLHDIHVRSRGRMVVRGTAASPVEGLTVRNLHWTVTGDFDPEAVLPTGSGRVTLRPDGDRRVPGRCTVNLDHVQDACLQDIRAGLGRSGPVNGSALRPRKSD